MLQLIDLAIEIAREGREERRIGTLFVIGDEEEVCKRSRYLVLDPLLGHPKTQTKLTDPNLRETAKEAVKHLFPSLHATLRATFATLRRLMVDIGTSSRHIR